jgi:hypothetical protein
MIGVLLFLASTFAYNGSVLLLAVEVGRASGDSRLV